MEARRRDGRAGLVPAASTALGLANVVCGAWLVSAKSVVCADGHCFATWQTESRWVVPTESISGNSTAFYSRDVLPLSFHDRRGTSTNRRVVETSGARRIFAGGFARRRAVGKVDALSSTRCYKNNGALPRDLFNIVPPRRANPP